MSISLIPDLSNWIFYAFVAVVVVAGVIASAVVLGGGFRHYSRF